MTDIITSIRRLFHVAFFLLLQLDGYAQYVSGKFEQVPMSQALAEINSASTDYDLFFLYDELESFPVTCQIKHSPVIEAIQKIIGFYPVKMTISGHRIFIECQQKKNAVARGRVVGPKATPIPYASVTLSYPHSGEIINTGICNESGDFAVPFDSMTVFVKISCLGYKNFTGVFNTGDIGIIRLQPTTYHLHSIEVLQRRNGEHRLSNVYHRHAEKIREKVWSKQDSYFDVTQVPDSLSVYPEVVIARSQEHCYNRKFLFRPWHLLASRIHNPLGAYRTTAVSIDRRRVMINDEQTADKYTLLDYPRDIILSANPDKDIVMGIRVIKSDGTLYEVETDKYTQPVEYNEPPRPERIMVEGLESGDIIDYFIWTQTKTFVTNPEPVLITIDSDCPHLSNTVSVNIDKNLNVQYRPLIGADTLHKKYEADGNTILYAHYKNLKPNVNDEKRYAVYVRDEDLKVNAPINAKGHHVVVDPDILDILNTKEKIFEKMKIMSKSDKWKVNCWNETDTTVISAIVSNLSRKTKSKELLAEALYWQALRFPSYLIRKHRRFDGCEDDVYLNREYTIMFAYMLHHAGIPFQIAMTTKKDREDIDQLMDENNIVWMIRTDDGQCFIPRFDHAITSQEGRMHVDVMAQQLVGRKARLINGGHSFLVTKRFD